MKAAKPMSRAKEGRPDARSGSIQCKWYIADDIREELSGKLTLVGLYADDIIVVEMPSNEPDPTPEEPIHLSGLAILCVLLGLEGSTPIVFSLGEHKSDEILVTGELNASRNLISRFPVLQIASFGYKTVAIEATALGFRDEYRFEVRRRSVKSTKQLKKTTSPIREPSAALPTLKRRTKRPA
jgi:hypothetical protein